MESAYPYLVSQDDFEKYTYLWENQLNDPTGVALSDYFPSPDDKTKFLSYVYLPVEELIRLISAVGTVTVKARFGIWPVEDRFVFTIFLFGCDSQNTPTTGYISTSFENPQTLQQPGCNVGEEVPDALVMEWIKNWQNCSEIERSLFEVPDGPLRGYTFVLDDFMDTMFPLSEIANQHLRISFALHKFYKPGPLENALTATFGLVLDIPVDTSNATAVTHAYYDISMPCPSTC